MTEKLTIPEILEAARTRRTTIKALGIRFYYSEAMQEKPYGVQIPRKGSGWFSKEEILAIYANLLSVKITAEAMR